MSGHLNHQSESQLLINNQRDRLNTESAFKGKGRGLSKLLPFLGPAFIASVAYLDPGNFATNITAGSRYG